MVIFFEKKQRNKIRKELSNDSFNYEEKIVKNIIYHKFHHDESISCIQTLSYSNVEIVKKA